MKLVYLADNRFPIERANGIQAIETCHALARRGVEVELVVQRAPMHERTKSVSPILGSSPIRS